MSEKKERLGLVAVAVLAGLCLGGWLGNRCNHFGDGNKKVTVDTVVVKDTVHLDAPKAADTVVTGTIRVPMVVYEHDGQDMLNRLNRLNGHNGLDDTADGQGDTADVQNVGKIGVSDTVWATVPRTQKRYEDSTYTAWVSGYEARLDSIEVYRKTTYITKREEGRVKNKRISLGLTGGFGYGLTSRKPDLFIGVGCTWRIF